MPLSKAGDNSKTHAKRHGFFFVKIEFWHRTCCGKSLCKSLIINELRRARPFTQVLDYQRVTKGTPDSANCSGRADGDRQGESYLLIYIYVFVICKQSCKNLLRVENLCSMFSLVGTKPNQPTNQPTKGHKRWDI